MSKKVLIQIATEVTMTAAAAGLRVLATHLDGKKR
jgi:hypothetical protein